MCLIAYVRAGAQIPEENFRSAARDNSDGIGIMSADGVERFLGRKMVKRAWRYTRQLHESGQEFAVHFRFATHGRVALRNTHPFKTPDGNAYVMHNGILSQYTPKDRNGEESDTSRLVDTMVGVDVTGDTEYWEKLETHIGWGNKLCVMSYDGQFRIVNDTAGDWIDRVWYSQTYSLPGCGYADYLGTPTAVSGWNTGGYLGRTIDHSLTKRGAKHSYIIDTDGRYREIGYAMTQSSSTDADRLRLAYERRDSDAIGRALMADDAASGAGTHSLPADTYRRDDDALDAELERHFAAIDDGVTEEPTDICPSCECLHNDGPHCPECGYVDAVGMLPGAVRVG